MQFADTFFQSDLHLSNTLGTVSLGTYNFQASSLLATFLKGIPGKSAGKPLFFTAGVGNPEHMCHMQRDTYCRTSDGVQPLFLYIRKHLAVTSAVIGRVLCSVTDGNGVVKTELPVMPVSLWSACPCVRFIHLMIHFE